MEKKVLLFDNPNGYAFLFLSKLNISDYEVHAIAEYNNVYNSNWPEINKENVVFYKSANFIKGIELIDGSYLKRDYFKRFDVVVSFTYTGLRYLTSRGFKPLYYNIGGFKDFYYGYKFESFGSKYLYKYLRALIFRFVLLQTDRIVVSNQMDFEHVFNSFFSGKIKFLPIFVPKWNKYNPSFSSEVNFVHFSAQSHRLKNNLAIYESLSNLKDRGVNFKLHIFLWGIHAKETMQILSDINFKDDIVVHPRVTMSILNSYIIKLPRVFVLGEFSDYAGPGSGGSIREAASAGIPCISYVRDNSLAIEPTSMYINSNAIDLGNVLFNCSNYNESQYFKLCHGVFNEFNRFYNESSTNVIFQDILNESL